MERLEFKGTQGDWNQNLFTHSRLVFVNQGATICEMMPKDFRYSDESEKDSLKIEIEANAKLIAVAPQLLKCLQDMVEMYEDVQPSGGYQGYYEEAIDVIKKALL